MVQFIASGTLKDSLFISFPTTNFPQGITEVTLFNKDAKPLAERLVYVNIGDGLQIKVTGLESSYPVRGKVNLKIKTSDKAGNPIPAQIAISVFDKMYKHKDGKNILTHYFLSSQLRGRIYNPDFYFNPSNKNRLRALDLLLLTQGWRRYIWDEVSLSEKQQSTAAISPQIKGRLRPIRKSKNSRHQKMLMLFNSNNSNKQMVLLDESGNFQLHEPYFTLGRRLYLKHFPSEKDEYEIAISDPFKEIKITINNKESIYPLIEELTDNITTEVIEPWETGKTIALDEVQIQTKKVRVFRDKYLGQLDSIAKIGFLNTDYIGACGYLNCTACGGGTKPIEGKDYPMLVGDDIPKKHPRIVGIPGREIVHVTYRNKRFTEEELLKKFNLTKIKGYYGKREFYQPNYEIESDPFPDIRNTLFWSPSIITNMDGEAEVSFYCSDINTAFIGIIEGLGEDGILGRTELDFLVNSK
ncbi:hypothetical protein P278_02510 [Zhouia amylolytica AD3]|uniref:Uncharacterized protein n=2 Tax=Zhouia amylolytica TaxID=376730 RepID=W2URP8_9FLAO|nr:hypothetical protein P278_02510 [Zhouia amylolytica AD3]